MRLLHLADVHLGTSFSAFGDLARSRQEDHLEAFRAIPDVVQEEGVHAVLIAGDLFDRPDPPDRIRVAAHETLRRIVDGGMPAFIVPGNHDPLIYRPNAYRDGLGGVQIFRSPGFQVSSVETPAGPLHVYGLAFDPAAEPEPLATFASSDRPGVHVALLHGSVPLVPTWEPSPNTLQLPLADLATLHVDYIALGDHHGFRPPGRFSGDEQIAACYAGSFAAIDLTETGPRGYVLVEIEPGQPPAVEHRTAGVRPVESFGELDVTGFEDIIEVADAVAARVIDEAIPVGRLIGAPAYPLDPDTIEAHLIERFGCARVTDDTHYVDSGRLQELDARDDLVGHVVRLGRERIEAAVDKGQRRAREQALRIALSALEVR